MNFSYPEIKNKILKYKVKLHVKKTFFLRNFNIKSYFRKRLHFIHIGRTAGSSIRHSLIRFNILQKKYYFNYYGHSFKLHHLSKNQTYFFTIRSPINRFASGFNDRKNRARFEIITDPKKITKYKISTEEQKSFQIFSNANHLAESIYSNDSDTQSKAVMAMNNIKHINDPYTSYFNKEDLIVRKPFFVMETEKLEEDFSKFCEKLKLKKIDLPIDNILKRSSKDFDNKKLSDLAILNLKSWYKKDFDFYNFVITNKHFYNKTF